MPAPRLPRPAARRCTTLLFDPPHSLYEQSWAPRQQRHGTVNADGFGVGWYVDRACQPVRYRRAQPIWTDASFAVAGADDLDDRCAVAAVRSATAGTSVDEAAAAPFTHDRWLFSHNGRLHDFGRRAPQARWPATVAPTCPTPAVGVDSALLFAPAPPARWQAGGVARATGSPTSSATVAGARPAAGYNLLATDGESVAATGVGDTAVRPARAGGTRDRLRAVRRRARLGARSPTDSLVHLGPRRRRASD